MTAAAASDLVVVGFGCALLSDDGVACHAIERLVRDPAVPAGVRLVDAGTGGSGTLAAVRGCRRLLVLDAVDVGAPPGTVVRVELDGAAAAPRPPTAHELGLASLLDDLRLLGEPPERTVLLGIQPASLELATSLSDAARAGLDALVGAASRELAGWAARRGASPAGQDDKEEET